MLSGIREPAPPPWWGSQSLWTTPEGELALILRFDANPMTKWKPWTRAQVTTGELNIGEDCYLAACFATTFRTMSKG